MVNPWCVHNNAISASQYLLEWSFEEVKYIADSAVYNCNMLQLTFLMSEETQTVS